MQELINQWMEHYNYGAGQYTRNLLGAGEYAAVFEPVYQIYENQREMDPDAMLKELYARSELADNMKKFIAEEQRASGMVITFGTADYREVWVAGNRQELEDDGESQAEPMERGAVFDLSSVTKLFTCIAVLQLVDREKLRLGDPVSGIDPRFLNLRDVTVEDLLSFRVPLKTEKRLEMAQSLEEAQWILFGIMPDMAQKRLYSDMGAMVLKYVVETVTGQKFYEWVRENILIPCGMQDTVIKIPKGSMGRTVSNNFERKVLQSGYAVESRICKGVVSDGKARRINEFQLQLHGHAGMFSTADDMGRLAQALLQGKVLKQEWMQEIGVNRTGKQNEDMSFTQFHGYLCYSKNPIAQDSEVSHLLSGNAFALGGYTGNHFMTDPNNRIFHFMASNRCHNRVSYIQKDAELERDCQGRVIWDDGRSYIDNTGYVYERDRYIIEPMVRLSMQYRFLEQLLEQEGRKLGSRVVERKIV